MGNFEASGLLACGNIFTHTNILSAAVCSFFILVVTKLERAPNFTLGHTTGYQSSQIHHIYF